MNAASKTSAFAAAISFPERSLDSQPIRSVARKVAEAAFARAAACDADGAYPAEDVAALHEAGLLAAPLPQEFGGAALSGSALNEVL